MTIRINTTVYPRIFKAYSPPKTSQPEPEKKPEAPEKATYTGKELNQDLNAGEPSPKTVFEGTGYGPTSEQERRENARREGG